jgi:hypothetical protein
MRGELAQEASDLRKRLGFHGTGWIRAMPIYLLVMGVFGVFLPWQKGLDFLDSVMLGDYACLGVVFAAPAAATAFDQNPTTERALARVAISVFYGELVAGAMSLLGMITVYVSRGGRIVVGPDLRSLAECAAFGLTLSLATCTAAVYLSLRFSPRVAKSLVRLMFLGLLVAFYLRSGWLPTVALRGAGVALAASLLFLLALRATLAAGRRDRRA